MRLVELFECDIKTEDRQSSKGNQLKWLNKNTWYKADYTGYEGLSEYIVSRLLQKSSLREREYVLYETEQIKYRYTQYYGCRSRNFLPDGWSLITLERLFQMVHGQSLSKCIFKIEDYENRVQFLVDQMVRITGLQDFGQYLCKLITIDAFFLNEDRHFHNIAVLMDETKAFHYCPVFDCGGSLLSDTTLDYPMGIDVYELMKNVHAKTFGSDFDIQLETVEALYGQQLVFDFSRKDVEDLLNKELLYPKEVKRRVFDILMEQCRKYKYLFSSL